MSKGRSDNVNQSSFDQGTQPTLEEVVSIYLNNEEGINTSSALISREILAEKFLGKGIRRRVQASNIN